jgi:hypothetical protein
MTYEIMGLGGWPRGHGEDIRPFGTVAQPLCPALSILELGHNRITAQGSGQIARALPQCRMLCHLNLQDNRIVRSPDFISIRVYLHIKGYTSHTHRHTHVLNVCLSLIFMCM